jgi:hypothetical protein
MHHRINSILHLVSACYWALGTILGWLFGPAPFRSTLGFRLWVSAGIGWFAIDLLAAVKQWRGRGRLLSIVLHFGVAILVVSLITFEFMRAQPRSFFAWFNADNYWFIAGLALARVFAGAALLVSNGDRG